MNRKLKLVVIGGGSSYTPELIEGIIKKRKELPITELILVDVIDGEEKLKINYDLVKRMFKKENIDIDFTYSLDRKEALKGADFVLTQFRVGGFKSRILDEEIPLKYGFIGQETTGAGGFAKALRTIPVIIDICKDMEEVAKNAWLINFTNPAGIITEAINKYTNVKAIGVCNVPINMRYDVANQLGISLEKIRVQFVGLNHLSFISKVIVDGKNIIEKILFANKNNENIVKNIEKIDDIDIINQKIGLISSPYLQYFYFPQKMINKELENINSGKGTRGTQVAAIEKKLFEKYKDPNLNVKPKELEERGGARYSEIAINVIDSIYNNKNKEFVVNTINNGTFVELPNNVSIETNCIINNEGARPINSGKLPKSVAPLIKQVKAYEEYTIEAAVEGNKRKAYLALFNNPLVNNKEKIEELLNEIIIKNKKYLPNFLD
ncbi:6-phospho-beta-glucosidase [Hypnocyclicus thermotrophus]|uniref:6-phospho-beta-glucosidase n=1 Tax=Hypnocyclicus thermotrophus TaxID=1627895 RepID=A0AA46I6R3_9FUSO|nr:6-phospho-beta-glucosidase [Hypnocyclicus thermotrophus]TDT71996.1 6-phospho-beta-glucosidase [Hypnocyclicus thermotrophus]